MKVYLKSIQKYLIGAVVFILISTTCSTILQFLKGDVLDFALSGNTEGTIRAALILITLIVLESITVFAYSQLGAKYTVQASKILSQRLWETVMEQKYPEYKQQTQGAVLAKFTNDINMIRDMQFEPLTDFFSVLAKIVFVSIALFILDWRIALLTLFLLSMPLYVPKLLEHRLQSAKKEYAASVEHVLEKLTDWLSQFELIKNYSIEHVIQKRFQGLNEAATEDLYKNMQLSNINRLLSMLMSYVSYFFILIVSAVFVLKGSFSAGDFFVAIGMIDQLSYPIISLSGFLACFTAIRPVAHSMEEYISKETQDEQEEKQKWSFEKELKLSELTFSYEGEMPLIDHFSISLKKGGRYLLKGVSGSGKTTITDLILGYYKPLSGMILLDGRELAQKAPRYDLITVVRQDAALFHDTLRNNITMYADRKDEEILSCMRLVGLDKYASAQCLDRMVDEDGTNLSGGEKKRICLVRALLHQTPILILDEPLANLDENTVDSIEDTILAIPDRTILVVSHYFSQEKLAGFDEVITLKK